MTGVLLVNMGGPETRKEMKIFLSRMFRDPYILPSSRFFRIFLSFVISTLRYRKSWKKYELIGGTPIISATRHTVNLLQDKLNDKYKVRMAFSYSAPLIEESLMAFDREDIKNVTIIPLYPQSSISTTLSVKSDVERAITRNQSLKIKFVHEFYPHEKFIAFWSEIIAVNILENHFSRPLLLFSAHSIPVYLEQKKGDTYRKAIEESARLIAENIGLEYDVAYQSGMKRGEWLKPDLKKRLKEVYEEGKREIVIIPISFVNENLETLYDLDRDIIPYAKQEIGFKSLSRVKIPVAHELYIMLLCNLIKGD